MARPGHTYRAARKAAAKEAGFKWRDVPRRTMRDGAAIKFAGDGWGRKQQKGVA